MDAAPLSGFDPSDPDAWAVLADWLTAQGDPRGELLALELARVEAPPKLRPALHRYAEGLWPVFGVGSEAELRRQVDLRWRAGLVISARLLGPDPRDRVIRRQLRGLLDSDAAVALAELRCDFVDPRSVVEVLGGGPTRGTIRTLTLGDYRTKMPGLDRLWPRLSGLRELELLGPGIVLGELARAVPRLERLRLACELDPTPLRGLSRGVFGRLRALELRLGGDDYFADVDELEPVFTGQATPALERLGLHGVTIEDWVVEGLVNQPLGQRIRELDLSDSQIEPPLLRTIRTRFGDRLRGVDPLSPGARAR